MSFRLHPEAERELDEAIDLYHQEGKPLPPPTAGQDIANTLQQVT